MKRRPWTKDEINILFKMAGIRSLETISKKLKRSIPSIKSKALRLNIKLAQGTYSITQVAKELGVSEWQVHRLCQKLGVNIRRRVHNGSGYGMFSEEQLEDLKSAYNNYLDSRLWSWDSSSCIICGTTEKPHAGGGLCRRCYVREKTWKNNNEWTTQLRALITQIINSMKAGTFKTGYLEFDLETISGKLELENYECQPKIQIPKNKEEKT